LGIAFTYVLVELVILVGIAFVGFVIVAILTRPCSLNGIYDQISWDYDTNIINVNRNIILNTLMNLLKSDFYRFNIIIVI
jgi:hypothetical protein